MAAYLSEDGTFEQRSAPVTADTGRVVSGPELMALARGYGVSYQRVARLLLERGVTIVNISMEGTEPEPEQLVRTGLARMIEAAQDCTVAFDSLAAYALQAPKAIYLPELRERKPAPPWLRKGRRHDPHRAVVRKYGRR